MTSRTARLDRAPPPTSATPSSSVSPRDEEILGWIELGRFLDRTSGVVTGQVLTDAKVRRYRATYISTAQAHGELELHRNDDRGDVIKLQSRIPINRRLVALFGLYSGDGAKGSEDPSELGVIEGSISLSQKEAHLVRFAAREFRILFGDQLRLTFSIGEDSAYFMAGEGLQLLCDTYGGTLPAAKTLHEVRPNPSPKDRQYLAEVRDLKRTGFAPDAALAFYYQHKEWIRGILKTMKQEELKSSGVTIGPTDRIEASPRRPFKKGASEPGGTSRADELHVGGLNGYLPLFLKIMHEIEDSLLRDAVESSQGLVRWNGVPSSLGEEVQTRSFFESHACGQISGQRPSLREEAGWTVGLWPRSREQRIRPSFRVTPLFAYACGLYLAEGATPKERLFRMATEQVGSLSFEFTSSEDESLRVILTALEQLFPKEDVVSEWKVKVGSSYFPELVQVGLKHGVPMLRGGEKGQGKMRTMEISLSIQNWALTVCPSMNPFIDKFTHVEPTGSGVARVHFGASSTLARWFFPIMMHAVFGEAWINSTTR